MRAVTDGEFQVSSGLFGNNKVQSRIVTMVVAGLAIASANTPNLASSVDLNGGSSWGGWTFQGNSLDDGVWADDATDRSFDVYTTFFNLDGSQSASGDLGTTVLGLGEKNGTFQNGNRVVGVGVQVQDDDKKESLGFKSTAATIKFDPDKDSYSPASSVGAGDGKSSSSSFSDEGDFNVQLNGRQGRPSESGGDDTNDDGYTNWTPSFFTSHEGSGILDNQESALFAARSFARQIDPNDSESDIDSFQMLLDVDALQNSPWNVTVGDDYNLVVGTGGTDTAFENVSAVPLPGSAWAGLSLLGVLGGGAAVRRWKAARAAA